MKVLIAIFVSAFAVSANALESQYGKIAYSGGRYHCVYTNHGEPKNMKWVVFAVDGLKGDGNIRYIRKKVDRMVYSGESIFESSGVTNPYRQGWFCKFLVTDTSYEYEEAPLPN